MSDVFSISIMMVKKRGEPCFFALNIFAFTGINIQCNGGELETLARALVCIMSSASGFQKAPPDNGVFSVFLPYAVQSLIQFLQFLVFFGFKKVHLNRIRIGKL